MTKIRVTKEFTFEASHVLKGYDGLCKNIHGHSYKLFVTIVGEPIHDETNVKNGMVLDFGVLKGIVKERIVDVYDHSLIVNNSITEENKQKLAANTERLIFTPFQPTCENLVFYFASEIKKHLPQNITLKIVRLYETANSYAEWYDEDNL